MQLIFPQDGMNLYGNTFTVRGQVEDPTATVTATLVNTNGSIDGLNGFVERSGQFWLENLPLTGGTNTLTLTVTDVAGNSSVTNISFVQTDMLLTINSVPDDQLHLPTVTVAGTVQDGTYSVWVNGVQASVDQNGNWTADGVPVNDGGTACFYAQASPAGGEQLFLGRMNLFSGADTDSSSGSSGPTAASNQDKKPQVRVLKYTEDWQLDFGSGGSGGGRGPQPRVVQRVDAMQHHLDWNDLAVSSGFDTSTYQGQTCGSNYTWGPDVFILHEQAPSVIGTATNTCTSETNIAGPPTVYLEHCIITNLVFITNSSGVVTGTNTYWRKAQTTLRLITGGKPATHGLTLLRITGSATNITNPRWPVSGQRSNSPVSATDIVVGNFGHLSTDGTLYVSLPANSTNDFTVTVQGALATGFYTFDVSAERIDIPLVFRNTGTLTARETTNQLGQVFGYQADIYDGVSNLLKTVTLGTSNPPANGTFFFNFEETDATVLTNSTFNTGWQWHRDVQEKVFVFSLQTGGIVVESETNFTSQVAGEGAGNDSGGDAEDFLPDANHLIINCDGPGLTLTTQILPGTVVARRFYAREWLTWNGAKSSSVLRWRNFMTLKFGADGAWHRAGTNVIELTPDGDSETPAFTQQELMQILNQ